MAEYEVLKTGNTQTKVSRRWNVVMSIALIIPAFILGILPKLMTYFTSAESKNRKIVLCDYGKTARLAVKDMVRIPAAAMPNLSRLSKKIKTWPFLKM